MKTIWKKIKAAFAPEVRLVPVVLPSRQLDDAELRNVLANAPGTPLWDAVMQILLSHHMDVQGIVSNPVMAEKPGALAQAVSGQVYLGQAIVELQALAKGAREELKRRALEEARKQARKG